MSWARRAKALVPLFLDLGVDVFKKLETKKQGANLDTQQAKAISEAVQRAIEQGDNITPQMLDAALAALEVRLIKWMAGIVLAGIVLTVTILNLLP